MDLHEALTQISEIRQQVARTETFRGYRAAPVAFSALIACVAAGMVTGNWGAQYGMQPTTRIAVEAFWSYIAFALNSFVFLLMGLEINLATLGHYIPEILIGWVALNLARAALIYSEHFISRAAGGKGLPRSWAPVLAWG